jgi:hypothetical protein
MHLACGSFTLRWLRARDLSAVIDGMLAEPIFGRNRTARLAEAFFERNLR